MDKMNTYLKVVFIINFLDLKRSVVSVIGYWFKGTAVGTGSGSNTLTDDRLHPAGVGGGELQQRRDQEQHCYYLKPVSTTPLLFQCYYLKVVKK